MSLDIREASHADRKAIKRLASRSFGFTVLAVFGFDAGGHVAVRDGEVVGATVLRTFSSGSTTYGVLSWIMVSACERGSGVGQRLTDRAMVWFHQQECNEVFALVEGYNQSSSKLFLHRGFQRLSAGAQFARFGAETFRLWLRIPHLFTVGYSLWHRPAGSVEPPREHPWGQWIANYGAQMVVFLILALRVGILPSGADPLEAVLAIVLVPLAILGVRSTLQWLVATALGLDVRYRMWESGLTVSVLVAAIFGGIIVSPGSLYPVSEPYRYRDELGRLGPSLFAGTLGLLVATALVRFLVYTGAEPGVLSLTLRIFLVSAQTFLVVEVLTVFFPFTAFAGKHIKNWSSWAWVLLAVLTAALLALGYLLG